MRPRLRRSTKDLNMLRTLTIKNREYLTLTLIGLLLTVTAAATLWHVRAIEQRARDIDRASRAGAAVSAFAADVGRLVHHERAYYSSIARQQPADDLNRWNDGYDALLASLDSVEAVTDATVAAPVRAALLNYQREFFAVQSRIAPTAAAPIDQSAVDGESTRAAVTTLEQQVGALLQHTTTAISSGATRMAGGISRAYYSSAIAIAIALVIALVVLHVAVFGPVVDDAHALAVASEAMANGDLASRVPALAVGEFARVGRAVNTTLDRTVPLVDSRKERDRMQAAVMKLLSEVSGVAEGDLTVEAEVTDDVTGALADSFNLMIGQLRQIIGQVQAASRQISASVGELRDVTANLATGSDDQAAQAVEASVAIEEMAASIHYVSENASSSAQVAEQARVNAEHGTRAVTRTIEGMKAVRDQVQETAKRIKRLGESSQEIGEIVELIGDIGDRTSILALNASIQAAMAGEAGRGFAIVADEVERLADRATEATKRASMLVKATQGETAEVMTAMEDTTREVINRSNIANEAGVALGEIQGVSNRLAELLQAISDAAQQQARGSEQVAKSMNEMSAVTRSTAAGTKQTAAAINSLGLLVDNLNAIVTRFKLPVAGEAAFTQPRLVASR
jgi:methyl-accepting chemotaxis protein